MELKKADLKRNNWKREPAIRRAEICLIKLIWWIFPVRDTSKKKFCFLKYRVSWSKTRVEIWYVTRTKKFKCGVSKNVHNCISHVTCFEDLYHIYNCPWIETEPMNTCNETYTARTISLVLPIKYYVIKTIIYKNKHLVIFNTLSRVLIYCKYIRSFPVVEKYSCWCKHDLFTNLIQPIFFQVVLDTYQMICSSSEQFLSAVPPPLT